MFGFGYYFLLKISQPRRLVFYFLFYFLCHVKHSNLAGVGNYNAKKRDYIYIYVLDHYSHVCTIHAVDIASGLNRTAQAPKYLGNDSWLKCLTKKNTLEEYESTSISVPPSLGPEQLCQVPHLTACPI